jgi:hypothetical protein
MLPLAQIQFRHEYFSSRLCTGLLAGAAGPTVQTMTNHGLWWKATPAGFTLLYDANHAGHYRTRDKVLNGIVLCFLLRLRDPYFYNYTVAPAAMPGRQILYFYNRKDSPFLHADPQVSAADLVSIAPPGKAGGKMIALSHLTGQPFDQPFAVLCLHLRPGMADSYHIEFQPQSTTWHYIVVGRHLQDLHDPAVINTVTKERFKGPAGIRLTDGRSGLSFLSPEPIGCSERPAAACMLVEDFDPVSGRHKVVMPALPVPDPTIISRAVASADPNAAAAAVPPYHYSEIFIY